MASQGVRLLRLGSLRLATAGLVVAVRGCTAGRDRAREEAWRPTADEGKPRAGADVAEALWQQACEHVTRGGRQQGRSWPGS